MKTVKLRPIATEDLATLWQIGFADTHLKWLMMDAPYFTKKSTH